MSPPSAAAGGGDDDTVLARHPDRFRTSSIPETIVVQIAPLLLALGLELAAVLGSAILLVPVTPKRPVRATRFANPNSTEGGPPC